MATKNKLHLNGRLNGVTLPEPDPVAQAPAPVSTKSKSITIPKLLIHTLKIPVVGITPLLMCKFDEKVKRQMEEKTEGKAKNAKQPKDPEAEWNAARHISADGWDGIHAGGIRAAIIDAARSVDGLTMTELKQAIFIKADGWSKDGTPLVRIIGAPEKHSGMCRTTTGVAYPRHRPIYREWSAVITLTINGHILNEEQAVNLVSIAGFTCGVGEWRPTSPKSKTGDCGRFMIQSETGEV